MTIDQKWQYRAIATIPAFFVVLWASGFIAAKIVTNHADPLTALTLRYALVTVMMTIIALAMRAPWPKGWKKIGHIAVCGILMQVIYFGGSWVAMRDGVGAGALALIVCLQPVLTASIVGPLLGERVSMQQWLGLIFGLAGVALVVGDKLSLGLGTATGMAWSFVALLGMTFGTLYQKKFCSDMDMRTGGVVQFAVSVVVLLPLALIFEDGNIDWSMEFVGAIFYVAIVSSLISISLLTFMIKQGEASRVASFFFLVPSCALLFSWGLLEETISLRSLMGMGAAVLGVALVLHKKKTRAA